MKRLRSSVLMKREIQRMFLDCYSLLMKGDESFVYVAYVQMYNKFKNQASFDCVE
jgi:hypothetical protein